MHVCMQRRKITKLKKSNLLCKYLIISGKNKKIIANANRIMRAGPRLKPQHETFANVNWHVYIYI